MPPLIPLCFNNPVLPYLSMQLRLQAAALAALPGADVASVLVRPCPDPK